MAVRLLFLTIMFAAVVPGLTYAQRSNVDILGDLAVGCIGPVATDIPAFILDPSSGMPYLRPRLTRFWRDLGKEVYLADSVAIGGLGMSLHRLRYVPEEAVVSYAPLDGGQLERTISLSISHSLVEPAGLLIDDGRCRDQFTDSISRSAVLAVERDPFPETRGEIPQEGSWRDWGEPVVLGASVAIVVYLFFSIRS